MTDYQALWQDTMERLANLEREHSSLVRFIDEVRNIARNRNPKGVTILDFMTVWNQQYEKQISELKAENARLREELAKSRLVWSDEAPKEEGWYQYRPRAGTVHWRGHAVYFVVRRKGVLEAQDCPVCQVPGQWAGPIPEPQEPSE